MTKARKASSGRVEGGFVALPWAVLDCDAYRELSHPARSLLLEIARQYVRDNNGRLLTSMRHLGKRGWKSADVISRAKRELIAGGFIHETVHGHRPNRASWYAITWQSLDWHKDYDPGAKETFRRGSYAPIGRLVAAASLKFSSTPPSSGATAAPEKTHVLVREAA